MRKHAVTFLLVAACGGGHGIKDAPPFTEPPNPHDSASLPACTASPGTTISARRVAFGCGEAGHPAPPKCMTDAVLLVTSPPADGRLFAIERSGAIRIIENEVVADAPFLDLSADNSGPVVAGGEQGLLGLAFHPNYANNGRFFVDFTGRNPDTTDTANPFVDVVMEFSGGLTDPAKADPTSGKIILSIPDFASNHNGGMIEFGNDGYLYVATGDGGNAGDPNRNGQNTHALLAKILRIDVDHPAAPKPYGIPADNPFADGMNGAPEVWVFGVRNPWRWSFDRMTGDMWIGDVGQNQIEELDVLVTGQQAGKNLGWSMYEADRCCSAANSDKCSQGSPLACDPTGKVMPQFQVLHTDNWLAIIGGQVYRGSCYPDIVGTYFFSDNNFSHLTSAKLQADGSVVTTDVPGTFPAGPASIHADARGEIYETDVRGGVWHLEASP
ncbi:MAG TPA: PQQ-dependent sugar dehydrogenase [Kofleriaceae bacterium]|jgi:glucose/arabinose dehydrogenase|nr:PQQ-dependent sugar dehydrogenase [Kofleriaceae bacterium]